MSRRIRSGGAIPFGRIASLALRYAPIFVVCFASTVADASPEYPFVIQGVLGLKNVPPCTICHATQSGGTGTITKYFGQTMQSMGVHGADDAALVMALQMDKAQQTDSDGDGIPDVTELINGTDPNDGPGPIGGAPVQPEYGCSVGLRGSTRGGPSAVSALFAMASLAFARGRSRRTRSSHG